MKPIQVAVGIIRDQTERVLVGQRLVKDAYYQKWEFPGGKLEVNETPTQALKRELHEELGIQVTQSKPIFTLEYDYPDRQVRLFVQQVIRFTGKPHSAEGQALQWVKIDELNQLDFLTGNQAIIEFLVESC